MVEGDDQSDAPALSAGGSGKVGGASGKVSAGSGKAGAGKGRATGTPKLEATKPATTSAARPVGARIGVISDTHGYLDPAVPALFAGVSHIIHAGDVGDAAVLSSLEAIAPVTAVSGNVESDDLVSALPREVIGEIAGVRFVVAHKPKRLLKRLAAGRVVGSDGQPPDLVVFGHVHVPSALWVDGALYLNPGTASAPDEEDDGPTVVIVEVEPTGLSARFIPLARRRGDDGSPLVTRTR